MHNIKRIFLTIIVFWFSINFLYSQRNIQTREYLDTTSVVFQDIYQLWKSYGDDMWFNNFLGTNIDTKKYWAESEIEEYGDGCNLHQLFAPNYFIFDEFFIGINKRNDTLYELQTSFHSNYLTTYDLCYVITVPVIKTKEGYKFINKFSLNKKNLKKKKIDFIEFYYPKDYSLNKKQVKKTIEKVELFANNIGINEIKPIKYYINNIYTDILFSFGITTDLGDYVIADRITNGGRAYSQARLITYTKGGENSSHEIIHVLISDIRNNNSYCSFDEGVCSYFGDHFSLPYTFHVKKLKSFLNNNPKVNLSQDLFDAYMISNNIYTSDTTGQENNMKTWMISDSTSYSYIIMATICDIAFRQGGYDKVKKMIIDAKDGEAMYGVIEKHLGIKREEVDKYIRDFLNNTY
ncbi:MAG TPA: hypothetical protein DD434_05210 [Bacteroidales bacterium]|nr:hypothetical protein [Bacteroidales bacterium]